MPLESFEKFLEKKEDPFDLYLNKGVDAALLKIGNDFENSANEEEKLPFHNREHTEGVIRRTSLILSALKEADPLLVNEQDIILGRFAAAFHDLIQKWEKNSLQEKEFVKITRRRFSTDNERASADEAIKFMEEINRENDEEIFSENNKRVVREAIEVTIPGFDPSLQTVIQPNLKENTSLIARAVALADIGAAGMEGPEAFLPEGDALFREENLDILKALKNPRNISEKEKEYYQKRMLNWSKSQESFVQGRKTRLAEELQGIPEKGKEIIASLFNEFDDSVREINEKNKERENMSFEELAVNMGYSLIE